MKRILIPVLLVVSVSVLAQGNEPVQRSSSPSGLKINDSGQVAGAGVLNNATSGSGEPSSAVASTAQQVSGKSALQIQGNTAIKASGRNLSSVAAGRNSAAGNEVGAIGK